VEIYTNGNIGHEIRGWQFENLGWAMTYMHRMGLGGLGKEGIQNKVDEMMKSYEENRKKEK